MAFEQLMADAQLKKEKKKDGKEAKKEEGAKPHVHGQGHTHEQPAGATA